MTSTHQPRRKLTYADYCAIPEDLQRHEILDGEHVVSPAPNVPHQSAVLALAAALLQRIQQRGLGRVFVAPIDVQLGPHDVAQPDVIAITAPHLAIVTQTKIAGAPDLVVEVLSPSTARRDRGLKASRYALAGVREYWLVDPEARRIEQFELVEGRFVLRAQLDHDVRSLVFPGVSVGMSEIFADTL